MASNPRKVSKIEVRFSNFPQQYSAQERNIIEKAAKTCPVALSLHPDLIQDVAFIF